MELDQFDIQKNLFLNIFSWYLIHDYMLFG